MARPSSLPLRSLPLDNPLWIPRRALYVVIDTSRRDVGQTVAAIFEQVMRAG